MSFGGVMTFAFVVCPVAAYAVRATAEKVCKDRMERTPTLAYDFANCASWVLGVVVLSFVSNAAIYSNAGSCSKNDLVLIYAYISVVASSFFFFRIRGKPDWEKVFVACFVYVFVVYTWSDDVVLRSLMLHCNWSSFGVFVEAASNLIDEFEGKTVVDRSLVSVAGKVIEWMRVLSIVGVVSRTVYSNGYLDPLVVALDLFVVFGHRLEWSASN